MKKVMSIIILVGSTPVKNLAADQFPYSYRLLKVISKTKKEE